MSELAVGLPSCLHPGLWVESCLWPPCELVGSVCRRKPESLWKPEGIISAPGPTTCVLAHAALTVAFQVQISRENKKEPPNRSSSH